jgi:hypothetical protein
MTLYAKPDVPRWMAAHAQWCIALFDLESWDIYMSVSDNPGGHAATIGKRVGSAAPDLRYRHADIEMWRELKEEDGRQAITHEFAHLLLGRIDQNVQHIIKLVPAEYQEHARQLYDDTEEEVIVRLTRAMHDIIPVEIMVRKSARRR